MTALSGRCTERIRNLMISYRGKNVAVRTLSGDDIYGKVEAASVDDDVFTLLVDINNNGKSFSSVYVRCDCVESIRVKTNRGRK